MQDAHALFAAHFEAQGHRIKLAVDVADNCDGLP